MSLNENNQVQGDLIREIDFPIVVVESIFPSLKSLEDEACVLGKRMTGLGGDDSAQVQPLSSQDLELLEELLFKLPKLHGEMRQHEMDNFYEEFRALPNRPSWEPVIIDVEFQRRTIEKIELLFREHRSRLTKWVKTGKIKLVDMSPNPEYSRFFSLYIFKDEAAKYLNLCGINWAEDDFRKFGFEPVKGVSSGAENISIVDCEDNLVLSEEKISKVTLSHESGINYPPLSSVVDEFVSTAQAAHYLGRKSQTLRMWASQENGPIIPKRSGRMLRWSMDDIRKYLK